MDAKYLMLAVTPAASGGSTNLKHFMLSELRKRNIVRSTQHLAGTVAQCLLDLQRAQDAHMSACRNALERLHAAQEEQRRQRIWQHLVKRVGLLNQGAGVV